MENLELLKILNEEIGLLKERIEELKKENNTELLNLKREYREINLMYNLVCLITLINTVSICVTEYLKL